MEEKIHNHVDEMWWGLLLPQLPQLVQHAEASESSRKVSRCEDAFKAQAERAGVTDFFG